MSQGRKNLLLIGGIGASETHHVGDEAMLEADIAEIRRRYPESRFTVISPRPSWTEKRYGVRAIRPIGFPSRDEGSDEDRERLLRAVVDGTGEEGSSSGVIEAVAASDAVVVCGGGNLNSAFPDYLYERVAVLEIARRLRKPSLVLGQTLGPDLSARERDLLKDSLGSANLVGLRERYSLRLARRLGLSRERLSLQLDDAFFLEPLALNDRRPLIEDERPWVALTLTRGIGNLDPWVRQLREIGKRLGLGFVFAPHSGDPDPDRVVGEALAAAMGPDAKVRVLEIEEARIARWRIEGAALVISTRYHPIVFGLAAGVPSLGIYLDEYTRMKIQGALDHGGLGDWALPHPLARDEGLLNAALELWSRREPVQNQIERHRKRWQELHRAHWSKVFGTLDGQWEGGGQPERDLGTRDPDFPALQASPAARPAEAWSRLARAARTYLDRFAAERLDLWQHRDEAARYAESLQSVLHARDVEIETLKRLLADSSRASEIEPVLRAREAELESLKSVLQAREEQLESIKPVLQAREEQLESIKPVLRAREQELASVKSILREREEELVRIRERLQSYESALLAYRTSLTGKIATVMLRLKGKIPDPGRD